MGMGEASRETSSAVGSVSIDVSAADVTLSVMARGLYVGGSGDVKVRMPDGSTPTFGAVAAGIVLPIEFDKVFKVGTTATTIIAVY